MLLTFTYKTIIYSALNTDQNRLNLVDRLSLASDLIYMSGDDLKPKIQSCPDIREGVQKGQKRKNCFFSSQLIENLKLYSISKNQPSKFIGREGMRAFPLFDLEKGPFLPYLLSKLS